MRATSAPVASASCPNNVEINASDATKGAALLGLCKALSVDPAETLAFGDGLNDIPMLRAAGVGVAMGNAVEAVKALTGRMTFDELAALRDRLRKQVLSSREADASELFEARPDTGAANSSFKI